MYIIIHVMCMCFYRKLNETELENILLRDPNSRSNRLHSLHLSGTVGTCGHFNADAGVSLLSCVRVLSKNDISASSDAQCLGSGRFGTCFLRPFSHYSVCEKVFKHSNNAALIHEANILARFTHQCLPYLFGVYFGDYLSIITSFHGLNGHSVTVHTALFTQSHIVKDLIVGVDWMKVIEQIILGLEHLHSKHKILHNDLKGDNIVLSSTNDSPCSIKAVIIDFGKACDSSKGKLYKLSHSEREHYKTYHPHIAPDLRDGLCPQSMSSDIYSLGRLMGMVNTKSSLKSESLNNLSQRCTQYHMHQRPHLAHVKISIQ